MLSVVICHYKAQLESSSEIYVLRGRLVNESDSSWMAKTLDLSLVTKTIIQAQSIFVAYFDSYERCAKIRIMVRARHVPFHLKMHLTWKDALNAAKGACDT